MNDHKSFREVISQLPDISLPTEPGLTPFAQAMLPDELKSDDAVESYRMFYMKDKAAIGKRCCMESPRQTILVGRKHCRLRTED